MNQSEIILWNKIKAFEIDDNDSAYTFSDRLSKENQWSTEFTLRAIEEYKKFMFLVCIADHPLTPSEQVDEVWHLHLLYTRSYWKDFCASVLEKEVHHGPTRGGKLERDKFDNWYERTLSVYKSTFHTDPPKDIWPLPQAKIPARQVKVDTNKYWIIKKPF